MYKNNRGLLEWTLDINKFVSEFYKKCEIFNIIPKDVIDKLLILKGSSSSFSKSLL